MIPESFLAPGRLWFLLLVPLLAGLYLWRSHTRNVYAVRFAALPMLEQVAPRRPRWRRHVVALGMLLGVTVLLLAFARPAAEIRVPKERATVVLAIDTSLSMNALDVAPSRLEAAQSAARDFATELPPSINLGLVTFAGSAAVVVPPTTDRTRTVAAIDGIKLGPYTAIGEGIFTSLASLDQVPADPSGEPVPAHIVLLSDGETTIGRPNTEAAESAREAQVPVSTIAFGTATGTVLLDGDQVPVPVNETELDAIAGQTGGAFYEAESLSQLRQVYDDIGSSIGFEDEASEITDRWVGLGLLALMIAAAGSLAWFGRLS